MRIYLSLITVLVVLANYVDCYVCGTECSGCIDVPCCPGYSCESHNRCCVRAGVGTGGIHYEIPYNWDNYGYTKYGMPGYKLINDNTYYGYGGVGPAYSKHNNQRRYF